MGRVCWIAGSIMRIRGRGRGGEWVEREDPQV